jgi:hypothetical protein
MLGTIMYVVIGTAIIFTAGAVVGLFTKRPS